MMKNLNPLLFSKHIFLCMLSILLTSSAYATVFNVRDFGATGDGVHDDSPAIHQAIAAAKSAGQGHTVLIPAGNYRLETIYSAQYDRPIFDEQGNPKPLTGKGHLLIDNASMLTLAGEEGTHLLMSNVYEHGIAIAGSDQITVEHLTIDYTPIPFTQGTIEAVDLENKLVTVQIQEGYADLSREDFYTQLQARRMIIFDPVTRQLDHEVVAKYKLNTLTSLGNGRWQINITSNTLNDLKPGYHLFTIIARRSRHAVMLMQTSNSTLSHLTVHSSPACAYTLRDSDAIKILNCKIQVPQNSDRLMTTNADGVHCKFNRNGPEIANCHFQGMDDDSVNIGSGFMRVLSQLDPQTIVVDMSLFEAGDTVRFIDGTTGQYNQQVKIESVFIAPYQDGINALTIKLDTPIENLVTNEDLGGPTQRIAPIRLPADERALPTLLINLDRCGKGSYIHHNIFENHRVRGILTRGPQTRIEHNTFRNLYGPAIFAGHEFSFLEGPAVSNLTIANNLFENICRSNIFICNTKMDRSPADGLENKHIIIRDNVFSNFGNPSAHGLGIDGIVIDLSNVEDVTISGNTFTSPSPVRNATLPLIKLGPSEEVSIKDNQVVNGMVLQATE